jgi:predicted nucleotide-binding protein
MKPHIFIGSSLEGYKEVKHLQVALSEFCECTPWKNAFEPNKETMANLINATQEYDFAAFILTPDDTIARRGINRKAIRNNILFEIGLFMGSIGQRKTFLVHCTEDTLDIPTDLIAIQRITYPRQKKLKNSMQVAATKMEEAIAEMVKDPEPSPTQSCSNFIEKIIKKCPDQITIGDLLELHEQGAITSPQFKELSNLLS